MKEVEAQDSARIYEVGFHIAPIVGDDGVSHEVSLVRDALDKIKAEVIGEDFPRLLPLAYDLSKMIKGAKKTFREAYFGWVKFEADAGTLEELKELMEKIDSVLRFIIIKTVKENTLFGPKFATKEQIKGIDKKEVKSDKEESEPVVDTREDLTPEELDKTIDDLVV